jgi:hypothetical protein
MYIVYETDNNLEQLRSKYLVLELDTIEFPDGRTVTAFAVVDSNHIPFQEVTMLADLAEQHAYLMKNYKLRNWYYCTQAVDHLRGRFKGELDTFYDVLVARIAQLESSDVSEDWTGTVLPV